MSRSFLAALWLIVLVSLVARLITLDHGLPQLQVTDENSDLSVALRLTQGELPATNMRYTRSLITNTNLAAVAGLFGYTYLTGEARSLSEFRDLYFSDRALFTTATRVLQAVLTSLAVAFVGFIGHRFSPATGLLAAALLAFNGFFTLQGIYALPESIITFAIALSLWLFTRLWERGRAWDYFLAGVGLAVVMISKLSAASIAVALVIAHLDIVRRQRPVGALAFLRRLLLSRAVLALVVGVIIGNLVLSPVAFIRPNDLIFELRFLSQYAYGSAAPSLTDRLTTPVSNVVGIIPLIWRFSLIATLLGFAAAIRWHRLPLYWMLVAALLALTITIGTIGHPYYRLYYWVPWIIPMTLVGGIGLGWLWGLAATRPARIVVGLGIGALLIAEALFTLHILRLKDSQDTRVLALAYLEATLTPDTRLAANDPLGYGVPMHRSAASIERALALGAPQLESWNWTLRLPQSARPAPAFDIYGPELQAVIDTYADFDALLTRDDIQYVVETDYCHGYIPRPDSDSAQEYPAIADDQRARWELVAVFSPFITDTCQGYIEHRYAIAIDEVRALEQQVRQGPLVRIYRVR